MQQHSLLATKLHIPPVRPELVSRPRLIEPLSCFDNVVALLPEAPPDGRLIEESFEWLE